MNNGRVADGNSEILGSVAQCSEEEFVPTGLEPIVSEKTLHSHAQVAFEILLD